jgi:co-chaperonin GroES (HSP10)
MIEIDKKAKDFAEKIELFENRIYIYVPPRQTRLGSILTPESYSQITEHAVIVKKGPDVPEWFEEGDEILISYYSGKHIQLPEVYSDSDHHRIIVHSEILAKYSEG